MKRKYYCDFIECPSLGRCLKPMSGEDCYTLGLLDDRPEKKEAYEKWLEESLKSKEEKP